MKVALYYFNECPYCQKVLRKISELNVKVELKNTLESKSDAQFHLQKTGKRTVPCLYIDENPMFESAEIIKWLDEHQAQLR